MSFNALKWALGTAAGGKLPPAACYLLVLLADYHNPVGGSFPSQQKLAGRMGVSVRYVKSLLRLLVAEKLIAIRPSGRRNKYLLMIPEMGNSSSPIDDPEMGNNSSPVWGTPVPLSGPEEVEKGNYSSLGVLTSSKNKKTSKVTKPSKLGVKESGVKIDEILKKHSAPTETEVLEGIATLEGYPEKVTPKRLGLIWRDLHALYHPNVFMPELTNAQMAQLKKAYTMAGPTFLSALPGLVAHWSDFVKYAKDSSGAYTPKQSKKAGYALPSIGFLLQYIQAAMNFAPSSDETPVQPVAQQEFPAIASQSPANASPHLTNATESPQNQSKPSKEELLEILGKY